LNFTRQSIPDVLLIKPSVNIDRRGYFSETFRKDLLEEYLGYEVNFVQDNESKSAKGVLRGLHFQIPPFAQAKLVRVIAGSVLDVAVDIRKASKTFGQYVAAELTSKNKHQLFVPRGFAHGFVVLSKSATFLYKVDNRYSPKHERGIAFNDLDLNIDWKLPKEDLIVSTKDSNQILFEDIKNLF